MTATRIFALIATAWAAFTFTVHAQTSAPAAGAYPAKNVKTAGLKAE